MVLSRTANRMPAARPVARGLVALTLAAGLSVPLATVTTAAPTTTATQSIDGLDAVFNFRDIGGLTTGDGRTVKPGLVYRSGDLQHLSDAGAEAMVGAGITNVVDLRTDQERADGPNRIPEGVRSVDADVVAGIQGGAMREPQPLNSALGVTDVTAGSTQLEQERFGLVGEAMLFPAMPNLESANEAYATMFREILDADGATLVHCTAGKDRTGWGMAVLQTTLGVPRDQVYADFLATNEAFGHDAAFDSWLDAAFNAVDRIYGSFDDYLADGIGLTDGEIDQLKDKLLA